MRRCGASSPHAAADGRLLRRQALQGFVDPELHRRLDDLLELRRFDRLGTAFDKQFAEFGRGFIAKPDLLRVEFETLFAQLRSEAPDRALALALSLVKSSEADRAD